jgi:hypothetical protein
MRFILNQFKERASEFGNEPTPEWRLFPDDDVCDSIQEWCGLDNTTEQVLAEVKRMGFKVVETDEWNPFRFVLEKE